MYDRSVPASMTRNNQPSKDEVGRAHWGFALPLGTAPRLESWSPMMPECDVKRSVPELIPLMRGGNPALVMNPENLAPCCDYRFRAHRSVVAVRWSHSVSSGATIDGFDSGDPARSRRSETGRSLATPVQNELYHTLIAKPVIRGDENLQNPQTGSILASARMPWLSGRTHAIH